MESTKAQRAEAAAGGMARTKSDHEIDPTPLAGTWTNTNEGTRGIKQILLAPRENAVLVHVFGVCDPSECDWGEVEAPVYATEPGSREGAAFNALYDFGFMETRLQAHIRQGLLVVAKFDRFKDDSGRANYFSKEFFFRARE